MWRLISLTCLLALVASMLIIDDTIQKHQIRVANDALLYAIVVMWCALMTFPGSLVILVIILMHQMKIGIIKIQLMDLLMQGSLTAAQLQDQYKEKWGRDLWLKEILQAMRSALTSDLVEISEGTSLEARTPLQLTCS